MEKDIVLVPTPSTLKTMKVDNRGVKFTKAYSSLDFDPDKANNYYHPVLHKHNIDKKISYSEDFLSVANQLMDKCKEIRDGYCSVHTTYPGIQWINYSKIVQEKSDKWRQEMFNKANHYFHDVTNNPKNIWGIDLYYCMCQEDRPHNTAYQTLLLSDKDDKWKLYHGDIIVPDDSDLGFHDDQRRISDELKEKIKQDSIDYLGQEYKIHLQPKPEYQIAVISNLISLISSDENLLSCLEAWKAIIPYNRVISHDKLPAIVIYPVKGKECAQYVLNKIINHFSMYDVKNIGLNITPRYNAKYNELIYWSNGSGDHKKNLSHKYFTSKKKIFYKGHEIYPIK